jgi:alkylhydroperoxidase family enzyme
MPVSVPRSVCYYFCSSKEIVMTPTEASPNLSARIPPVSAPYEPELDALLRRMTPPEAVDVLQLFRVFARHPLLAERLLPWGGFMLGRHAMLPLRDREVVIDRVCARCGAEYEWGVHVTAFAKAAGFTPAQVVAIERGRADDASLTERDALLVRLVDSLHDTADVDDDLWAQLAAVWSEPQLLELLLLAGWYRAISYVCNAARVPLERWQARFGQRG